MQIGENFIRSLDKDADGFYKVVLGRIDPYLNYDHLPQGAIDELNSSPRFGEVSPPKLVSGEYLFDQLDRMAIVPEEAICFEIAQVRLSLGIDGAQYISGKVRSKGLPRSCLNYYLARKKPRSLRFKMRGYFLPVNHPRRGIRFSLSKLITWDLVSD